MDVVPVLQLQRSAEDCWLTSSGRPITSAAVICRGTLADFKRSSHHFSCSDLQRNVGWLQAVVPSLQLQWSAQERWPTSSGCRHHFSCSDLQRNVGWLQAVVPSLQLQWSAEDCWLTSSGRPITSAAVICRGMLADFKRSSHHFSCSDLQRTGGWLQAVQVFFYSLGNNFVSLFLAQVQLYT